VRHDLPAGRTPLMLAANENPEPVAPEVVAGIQAAAELVNRYPFDAEPRVLDKLARYYRCSARNLVLVRGIDEAFDRLSHEFPSMRYAIAWPGFDGYATRIRVHGYRRRVIRLAADFALDPDDLHQLSLDDFAVLADPANPTGRPLSADEQRTIRELAGRILLDETYADYSERSLRRPSFGGKVFVFRSFSKSFGLAGARLGVVFGDDDVLARVRAKQWYCNVGVLDLCALETALEQDARRRRHIETTVSERERMRAIVGRLGFVVYPSSTNFILVRDDDTNALEGFLRQRAVFVRNTAQFGLADHVRISVGRPAENDRLLEALADYAEQQLHVR
jgi:histidinol-phosphate aminotransferase